ncbi:hypothetical protein [Chitinophaga sp. MM2321]|uniref:type IV toxin-antitoxin system AbiEi family antitoxin domain-containing protein n=1 Tax=Chitinophaga sp. MM2321 TaxID=3137178 RepID=UPI0032D56E05
MSILKDYKRPNDKIHALLDEGVLTSVKRGVYIVGPALQSKKPESFLLANHILGPSYVSLDTALSYYGLIPERVFEISSMTTKAARKFTTPAGMFAYYRLSLPYYAFGIQRVKLSDDQYALVASPEKALCDKIVTTPGVKLRSRINVLNYLLEDLRMEEDSVKELNTNSIQDWLPDAPKKDSLLMMIKTINSL